MVAYFTSLLLIFLNASQYSGEFISEGEVFVLAGNRSILLRVQASVVHEV
jgi:hypothetical protein